MPRFDFHVILGLADVSGPPWSASCTRSQRKPGIGNQLDPAPAGVLREAPGSSAPNWLERRKTAMLTSQRRAASIAPCMVRPKSNSLSPAQRRAHTGTAKSTFLEQFMLVDDSSKASPANLRHLKSSMLAVISALLCVLGMLPTTAHAASYSTDFPKAEPLISEGGRWITAGTPGVHWHETMSGFKGDQHVSSVSTISGYAFGPIGPERFGDSLALLTGTWKPDQMAQATVRQVSPSGYPEVEIRLRTSPKDATGYEIMWSALGTKRFALPGDR